MKDIIHNDLDEMENMITNSSRTITAGMVTVTYDDMNDAAFNAFVAFRIKRAQEYDVVPKNPHEYDDDYE